MNNNQTNHPVEFSESTALLKTALFDGTKVLCLKTDRSFLYPFRTDQNTLQNKVFNCPIKNREQPSLLAIGAGVP